MRTPNSLLVTAMVCLATGTLSFGGKFDTFPWPIGENSHLGVTKVTIGVAALSDGAVKNLVYKEYTYSPSAEGLEAFAKRELRTFTIVARQELEHADHFVYVSTDWAQSFHGEERNLFKLERFVAGWRLPEIAYNFKLNYSGTGETLTAVDKVARKVNRS